MFDNVAKLPRPYHSLVAEKAKQTPVVPPAAAPPSPETPPAPQQQEAPSPEVETEILTLEPLAAQTEADISPEIVSPSDVRPEIAAPLDIAP